MTNSSRWILLAVFLVGLVWLGFWWQSDERRLLAALEALEQSLCKPGTESDLVSLVRSQETLALFAPQFSLSAVPYDGGLSTPRELVAGLHRFRGAADAIDVVLAKEELELYENGTAWLLFRATVKMERGGLGRRSGHEVYRVNSQWVEIDGDWRVREIEVLEILSEGAGFGILP
ncbi:MAG: hypothetical protein K8J08_04645 [Thermoanaerobaculia bacterium]|nr:hypothetical protein [Thermoanaerobaculia bacterium]